MNLTSDSFWKLFVGSWFWNEIWCSSEVFSKVSTWSVTYLGDLPTKVWEVTDKPLANMLKGARDYWWPSGKICFRVSGIISNYQLPAAKHKSLEYCLYSRNISQRVWIALKSTWLENFKKLFCIFSEGCPLNLEGICQIEPQAWIGFQIL
jgi:hypothetical protein